jgi:hypothetical protein
MRRPIITSEAELRRVVLFVKSRVRSLDEFYRTIVRIAVVDLDDLNRMLAGTRPHPGTL